MRRLHHIKAVTVDSLLVAKSNLVKDPRFIFNPGQLHETRVANADFLSNAEMRQRQRLARTLMIEDLATVTTVMLSVCESELCAATHADVRVYPIWGGLSIDHR